MQQKGPNKERSAVTLTPNSYVNNTNWADLQALTTLRKDMTPALTVVTQESLVNRRSFVFEAALFRPGHEWDWGFRALVAVLI